MWRSTRSGQRSSSPHRVPCTLMGGIFRKQIDNLTCYMVVPTTIEKLVLYPIYDPDSAPDPETQKQCCGSGMFIPDPGSQFFHPGSQIQGQKDFGSASKNLSNLNLKQIVSKISEI